MSDPLSVAGSVAGLITIAAATSKLVYQFVSSVVDAPKEVQAITSSLYGMNIALCQIQTLLLDLSYSAQRSTRDLSDLERSIASGVAAFSVVDEELNGVLKATSKQLTVNRVWHQFKYVFEKESVRDALARLEEEKATLQLILTTLNSKAMIDILRTVTSLKRDARESIHILKHLSLQFTKTNRDAIGRSYTSTSTVSLDSVYTQAENGGVQIDSSSTFGFMLTDIAEDSASIVIVPDALSGLECVSTKIVFPSEIETPEDGASVAASVMSLPETLAGASSSNSGNADSARTFARAAQQNPTFQTTLSSYSDPTNRRNTQTSMNSTAGNQSRDLEHEFRQESSFASGRQVSMAQQITTRIQSERLSISDSPSKELKSKSPTDRAVDATTSTAMNGIRQAHPAATLPQLRPNPSQVLSALPLAIHNLYDVTRAYDISSSRARSHARHAKRAELLLGRLCYIDHFASERAIPGSGNGYLEICQNQLHGALKNYTVFIEAAYGPKRKSSLITTIQNLDERADALWAHVEGAMDELDRAINLCLTMQVYENTQKPQPATIAMHDDLLLIISRIEANQLRLEDRLNRGHESEHESEVETRKTSSIHA
ncbi:hypothetical protein TWF696_001005 [Orbilia brochopaga]|uniref:Azaphilone pigments biosynthesis cluster protein L N-terminal domain-containing protein n=1 Tax=Orbilia brochopaga TaxID=3140254 RepID=A0AAV9VFF2_9PEZI